MSRFLTGILIAMGLGGLALIGWVSLQPAVTTAPVVEVAPPPPVGPKQAVLVAAGPIQAGTLLKLEDLAEQSLLASAIPADASASTAQNRSALVGALVQHALKPGAVIVPQDIVRPGDRGFLAAALSPGMRAMTLGADSLASTLDLIWPGDHVDVILTQQSDAAVPARRVFGDTLLDDLRVVAVDQQPAPGAPADPASPKTARSVTLEVTPDQATRLTVATKLGKLALSVRATDTTGPRPGQARRPATIWAGDVAAGLGGEAAPVRSSTVHVWHGTSDRKDFQF